MSTSQRASLSPGGAASQGESSKAGAPYKPAGPGLAPLPTSGPRRAHATSSSTSMIGQIPSLFDPTMAIPPEGLDYNQWVESYGNRQYQYTQGNLPGNVPQVPFQQALPQSQLHHVPTTPAAPPSQTHFDFVPDQYQAGSQGPGYDAQFAQPPPPGRPQRGMPRISRRGGVPYPATPNLRIPESSRAAQFQQPQQSPHHQQQTFGTQGAAQGNDSYFYGQSVNADVISGSGDQQHHHSSYNFVPQYPPEQQYSATSYTPNSDFTNLPSSVSTPSVGGTDDGQHGFASTSSQHTSTQASNSRQPSGASTRARGRGGKQTAKRQRVEQADEDSDDQSDDDQPPTMAGLNMTVSVPPPQGQNSLPARL
ncbi:hypothetical protein C8Q78DRAFT_980588 [Trametes maxima]|nr:hypothetical protein C8Q78DRAFT_980588 [Trametes maxima]